MKYVKEFLLIILISFCGELLNLLIPLPIPGSVYGLVIMFTLLCLKVIKLDNIRTTSKFLIEIMPLMFIPAGVGLMTSFSSLKPILLEVVIITIITTILVMAVTGIVAELLTKKKAIKEENINEWFTYKFSFLWNVY